MRVQTRYPDSWYQERYNCTWEEFLTRKRHDCNYQDYMLPSQMFLTHIVGELIPHKWNTLVLCEKREQAVEPDMKNALSCWETTYSVDDKVLLKIWHYRLSTFDSTSIYDARTMMLDSCNPLMEVPDVPVCDISLMSERLSDGKPKFQRWIVNKDSHIGRSQLSLADQLAGKTHLKHELQVKEKLTDNGDFQMQLDIGMGAY